MAVEEIINKIKVIRDFLVFQNQNINKNNFVIDRWDSQETTNNILKYYQNKIPLILIDFDNTFYSQEKIFTIDITCVNNAFSIKEDFNDIFNNNRIVKFLWMTIFFDDNHPSNNRSHCYLTTGKQKNFLRYNNNGNYKIITDYDPDINIFNFFDHFLKLINKKYQETIMNELIDFQLVLV